MDEKTRSEGGQAPIEDLHRTLRKIAHDISNPLGVLRMSAYFLRTVQDDKEKRDRYLDMMDLNIDRIEDSLRQLRALTETGAPEDDVAGEKDREP